MDKFDVIVIGSGLGGLSAGAYCSRFGKRVLVLEQHTVVGGCATTFKRGEFLFEAGLHEMDGMGKSDQKMQLLKNTEVFSSVEFPTISDFIHVIGKDISITIPTNYRDTIRVLQKQFPDEKHGIKKFFRKIKRVHWAINHLPIGRWKKILLLPIFPILFVPIVLNSRKTVGKILDKYFTDEKLKLILIANLQYFHDDPHTLSMLYFCAAQGSYFTGAHFIKGGSQSLSNHFASYIKSHNGDVRTKCEVTSILIEDDIAVGVKYRNGSLSNCQDTIVTAKKIIYNGAIPLLPELIPQENVAKIKKKTDNMKIACSLTTIHLGLSNDIFDIGSHHYSTLFLGDDVTKLSDFKSNIRGEHRTKSFLFVDYGRIDSGLYGKDHSTAAICIVDYIKHWEKLSTQEYAIRKKEVAEIYITRLEKYFPGISAYINHIEVSTPKTIERYTKNPEGTPYGFAQLTNQAVPFRFNNNSKIKNLYLSSAWATPGGGFSGALISGYMTAIRLLGH